MQQRIMAARPLAALLVAALLLGALTATAHASDLNVVVILDNSGSMNERMEGGGKRIDAAKRSLLTVLEQTPAEANVGVVLLNPPRIGDDWLFPLGPVDPATVRDAVGRIVAGGPTPLGGAIKAAADALLAQRDAQRYGVYKLLIVSDGEATDGVLVERFLPEVQTRGVLVDVIGVAMGQQHSLATRANTYRNAADPASLEQAIADVVLGESTTDAGDAGESDFELIEPLPVELAAASLAALAAPSNVPIGKGGFVAAPPPAPSAPNAGQAPAAGGPGDNGGGGFSGLFIFFLFAMFLLFRMVTAANKNR